MTVGEVLGLIAGAFTTISLVPQVIRIFRLRSAREISLPFTSLYLVGGFFWLSYGIVQGLLPVIFWNAIATALTAALFYAKLKYGK